MTHQPFTRLKHQQLLKTQSYINGRWLGSKDTFDVIDPATGDCLVQVCNLDVSAAQQAIAAAHNAWPAWRVLTGRERSQLLRQWFDLICLHSDDLALLMTVEQGKPLAEAKGEVVYGASFVEWYAEEAKRIYGETLTTPDPRKRLSVIKQPVGVCAAITPWNFPLAMITRKVAPALAAGCTVVVKPAEQTPLTALALAELAHQAGLPPGVFNVLAADGQRSIEIGQALCASPVVRHLSFTGSTEVGRILAAQCAPTIKKLSLELGGNAPFIVFDDADLEDAVQGALISKYRNSGQTCVCANRFYVQEGIHDAFVNRFTAAVHALKVGSGLDEGTQVGPLIDEQALQKVQKHVKDALDKGAQVMCGAHVMQGQYYAPTVLTGATSDMLCAHEEIFGPVAPIFKFCDESEVLSLANHTDMGLAAYFYSQNIARTVRVSEALEYGMVGINTGLLTTAEAPFGGMKQSGLGREGGWQGLEEYLELKYLCLGGL